MTKLYFVDARGHYRYINQRLTKKMPHGNSRKRTRSQQKSKVHGPAKNPKGHTKNNPRKAQKMGTRRPDTEETQKGLHKTKPKTGNKYIINKKTQIQGTKPRHKPPRKPLYTPEEICGRKSPRKRPQPQQQHHQAHEENGQDSKGTATKPNCNRPPPLKLNKRHKIGEKMTM